MDRDHATAGFTIATDEEKVGQFFGLIPITEVTITAIEFVSGFRGDPAVIGVALPPGIYFPLRFTSIELDGTAFLCNA